MIANYDYHPLFSSTNNHNTLGIPINRPIQIHQITQTRLPIIRKRNLGFPISFNVFPKILVVSIEYVPHIASTVHFFCVFDEFVEQIEILLVFYTDRARLFIFKFVAFYLADVQVIQFFIFP